MTVIIQNEENKVQWSNLNPRYNDVYFTPGSPFDERLLVFFEGNHLGDRVGEESAEPLHIAELGFGAGFNLGAFLANYRGRARRDIHWHTVDEVWMDSGTRREALSGHGALAGILDELCAALVPGLSVHEGCNRGPTQPSMEHSGLDLGNGHRLWVHVVIGDVLDLGAKLPPLVDAWILDGHAPEKNPAMWSPGVFMMMAAHSGAGSTCATWSAAGVVKSGLRAAGFNVRRRPGHGGKRHRIEGVWSV